MKKLLVFNWKMNPATLREAKALTNNLQTTNNKNLEIVIAPPFIYLESLLSAIGYKSSVKLGAQDVFWKNNGAYTGEISPLMLKNSKVEYTIIGHSERRKYLGETDQMVNKKFIAALKVGFKVILCVGEDLKTRKDYKIGGAKHFVLWQINHALKDIAFIKPGKGAGLIVAYEPIWAIGTGRSENPQDAADMVSFIKKNIKEMHYPKTPSKDIELIIKNVRVLYGGSVDGKNINNFLVQKEINGVLVGGASLNPKGFKQIVAVASK